MPDRVAPEKRFALPPSGNFLKRQLRKAVTMEEVWKDIEGYEGLYQVSNTGLVRSFIRKSELQAPWHLIKPHIARGYVFISLYQRGKKRAKNYLLHRLVAKAFVQNPNNYAEVNHKEIF